MGRTLSVAVAAAACSLLLTGCGSDGVAPQRQGTPDSQSVAPSKVGQCPASSPAVKQAAKVATADVDGDSTPDVVKLTASDNDCPNVLFAQVGEGYLSVSLPVGAPLVTGAFGLTLEGHDGALLVTRQDNPRGGYQLRLFAADNGRLVELKEGAEPLVPFVATDTRPISATVDCQGPSIVVREAVAKSGGRWDIRSTSYDVDGSTVTKGEAEIEAGNLNAKQIDQLMPAGAAVFPSCGGPGPSRGTG